MMSKNTLYKSLIRERVKETLLRLNKETEEQTNREVIDNITALATTKKARPSLEDAKIYLEVLKQECPLIMSMTDYDIIKWAKILLNVNLTWKHLFTLEREIRPNPYYEILIIE
jgi:hypothetical protein